MNVYQIDFINSKRYFLSKNEMNINFWNFFLIVTGRRKSEVTDATVLVRRWRIRKTEKPKNETIYSTNEAEFDTS
jgi:hypothetical protein